VKELTFVFKPTSSRHLSKNCITRYDSDDVIDIIASSETFVTLYTEDGKCKFSDEENNSEVSNTAYRDVNLDYINVEVKDLVPLLIEMLVQPKKPKYVDLCLKGD
jgi:hypothetical protein